MRLQDHTISTQILDRLCVAGINFQKADTRVRGLFSVTPEDVINIADRAKEQNLRSVFVISTCNRTEIYGFAENVVMLVNLLLAETKGSHDEFLKYAYLKSGDQALQHLFDVACGIDSQILGDYEILGQLRQAVDRSASLGLIGPIMNRTVSYALQASKKVKTDTLLSTGTVSVSYAAIELLKDYPGIAWKKVLVMGAGKFGGNVCRNLKEYLPGLGITVSNRTDETAMILAERTGIEFAPYADLASSVTEADILIVCTNAQEATILPGHFEMGKEKLVLDLSVPVNVHPAVKKMQSVRVIDVDEISISILDKTLAKRKTELPRAQEIVLHYKAEFCTWLHEYRYSLHIKSWKDKLQELSEWQPHYYQTDNEKQLLIDETKVQKAVTRLAVNLRANQEKGCQFINAINDYLEMS